MNRTSGHFMMGYLSGQRHILYLQRGHRQYGNPLGQTLSAMRNSTGALDYELNLMRECECTCYNCATRGSHPVMACEHTCMSDLSRVAEGDI